MKFSNLIDGVNLRRSSMYSLYIGSGYGFVYFLLDKGECVYIGTSAAHKILERLGKHQNSVKVFDEVVVIRAVTPVRACVIEHAFIRQAKPKYNKKGNERAPLSRQDFLKKMSRLFGYKR